MTRNEIEAMVRRWMAYWQGAPLSDFNDVHAPDFKDRSANGRATDRAAFQAGIEELYRGFPDFRAEIDGLVVDEVAQQAAVRWHGTGTHRGPMMSFPATGKSAHFTGLEQLRFQGGQIVERWGETDSGALTRQLQEATPAAADPRLHAAGAPSWMELGVPSGTRARNFYGGLFGWSFDDMENDNHCARTPTLQLGVHPQDPDACVVVYFAVADIKAAANRVNELGGQAGTPGDEQPGFGRFLECRDDQGVRFGLRELPRP
jgi:predicted enzyme related to lactoylglutathione lyase/predicted ester cyclase